jgi:CobQ/CobB/MinD/ParA family nucleotide binding protein
MSDCFNHQRPMPNQIDIILNGKGGVGKSFFATNFVQFLKDKQIPHVAIDTDNENSTLKRFHGEAEFINIEDEQGIDSIFPALEKAPLVVVDCRAASTDIFLDYFAEVKVFDILRAMDARLTVISPVNHEADSIEQVKIVAEALGSRCKYVVIKNQAHSEHFTIYEKSKTRSRLIDELDAREIVMPKLYDWLVTGLNQTNLTITAAIANSEFSLVNRQRLKNWREKFFEEIERTRDILVPINEPISAK